MLSALAWGFLWTFCVAIDKEERAGFEDDAPPTFFSRLVMGFCIFVCICLIVGMTFLP